MRKDIADIARKTKEMGAENTIVTNGSLLQKRKSALPYIDHINLSLHTTNSEAYRAITNAKTDINKILS